MMEQILHSEAYGLLCFLAGKYLGHYSLREEREISGTAEEGDEDLRSCLSIATSHLALL